MRLSQNSKSFETCPDYTGPGVCVDVTPLKKRMSQFGEREEFRLVFEVDLLREDGSRFCVWSKGFTPSLHEKSGFRKFLKNWFARDLTADELKDFDTESLLGRVGELNVVQEHKDDQTFANILLCRPSKANLTPSGKFVRAQDRDQDGRSQKPAAAPSASASAPDAGYRKTPVPPALAGEEHLKCKVHVGRCVGLEVRDLSPEQLDALAEKWLPTAKAAAKQSADDKRLIGALEWYLADKARQQAAAAAPADEVRMDY
jgi:hypothetical protein